MRDDSSFIELKARQRAQALLDDGSYRELLDPFEGIISPWLGPQGIVPQADDGMVVAKGTINGQPAVVVAIEGTFGAAAWAKCPAPKWRRRWSWRRKITATAFRLRRYCASKPVACVCRKPTLAAAIADIHAAIVDLRRYTPVVGIVAGTVGCFGGMSIAAALCSYLIVTREARLGLNGPQVIEQEAGIEEYDSATVRLSGA